MRPFSKNNTKRFHKKWSSLLGQGTLFSKSDIAILNRGHMVTIGNTMCSLQSKIQIITNVSL